MTTLNTELRQEIATADKDPFNVYYDRLMRPQDDTLASRGGGRGLKIYDEIERDCHAFSVLQKRKLALISRPWVVEAASSSRLDKKARDLVEAHLKALNFDQLCLQLMDAILKGYAVAEIVWTLRGSEIVAASAKPRDARRFAFLEDGEIRMLTRNNMIPGEPLPERKFLVHRYGAKDGNPYGLGLGTRLFWPVWFKRQGIQFWLTFADKFGSPTSVGKYQSGASPADQAALRDAISRISQDAGVIIPEGMSLELLEAARSGSVNTYEALCRYMDEEISKAVLGETLSTTLGSGGGSLAAARTHNQVRMELVKADGDLLSDTLADLVKWIVEFNLPGATPPRVYRDCSEEEDLNSRAERDERLAGMGFKLGLDKVNEVYGQGYEVVTPVTPPAGQPPLLENTQDVAFAEVDANPRKDYADKATEQLDNDAQPQIEAWLAAIGKLVDTAPDLPTLQAQLLDAFDGLSVDQLAKVMGMAFVAAELAGMADVQDENHAG